VDDRDSDELAQVPGRRAQKWGKVDQGAGIEPE
jgi:hypothetical protein